MSRPDSSWQRGVSGLGGKADGEAVLGGADHGLGLLKVIRMTGFMKGLYTDAEMKSDNVKVGWGAPLTLAKWGFCKLGTRCVSFIS